MTDDNCAVVFREAEPRDGAQLKRLWHEVFGDPPSLVGMFLSLLPEMGTGCVAEQDGTVLGAAYLIDSFTLLRSKEEPLRCGYLYAVAVDPSARHRGLGAEVSRQAAALGKARGAAVICTLPAEDSLYQWYGNILSLNWRSSRMLLRCDRLPAGESISPSVYLERREEILHDLPHVMPSSAVMEFEAELCRVYGGGLYADGDAVFCAFRDEGRWVIPEYLPQNTAFRIPGLQARRVPYLCSDRPLPDPLIWNLTLD